MLLTLIDIDDGTVAAGSLAAIAVARELGGPVAAAVVTAGGVDPAVTETLTKHGVASVHVVQHELLADYSPELWREALAQLVNRLRPEGCVAAGSERGNELMAHIAARLELPLATGCVAVTSGEVWRLTRIRAGGVLLEDAELVAPVKLVTVQPGAAEPAEVGGADEVSVTTFRPELAEDMVCSRIVDRTARSSGVSLATAAVVVSGGRGVGSSDGFAPLEELAELVGGAVGCSRVATNNGWRPHRDQVGLTGTKVSPQLYIACGISGATQHWVGCMDAKAILAINTDAEAPMVTRANYAVIGDVHEVLAGVIAEIHRRRECAGRL